LHGIADLWIKRDDEVGVRSTAAASRASSTSSSARAIARRARNVATFGGIGTNHVWPPPSSRVSSDCAASSASYQPVTENVRQHLPLDQACGAELHYARTIPRLVLAMLRVHAMELLRGRRAYLIAPGGTSVTGVLGFVNAALELKEQIDAGALPTPDWIFVPVGGGGTLGGLALGCKLAGLSTRVAGVLVNDILPPTAGRVARLANRAYARLHRLASGLPYVHVSAAEIALLRAASSDAAMGCPPMRRGAPATRLPRAKASTPRRPTPQSALPPWPRWRNGHLIAAPGFSTGIPTARRSPRNNLHRCPRIATYRYRSTRSFTDPRSRTDPLDRAS
jgi:D-cysteine desulfhydrase